MFILININLLNLFIGEVLTLNLYLEIKTSTKKLEMYILKYFLDFYSVPSKELIDIS